MESIRSGIRSAIVILSIISLIVGLFLLLDATITEWLSMLFNSDISSLVFSLLVVFLLTFDVLLPVPSSLVSVAASSLLGLFSGALVIWVGMMAGSLFGYWVGARCNRIFLYKILGEREYSRAEAMMGRFGSGMLITMRAVPILAETSVILAGMAGMQKGRFLLAVTLSNTGVACAYGYIGATAQQESSMLILIAGSVLFAGAGFLLNTWMQHLYSEKAPENGSETVTADSDVGDKTLALEPQWSAQVIKAGFDIHYHYPVIFTRAIFASDNDCIRNLLLPRASSGAGVIVFVDEGVMTAQSSLPEQIAHYFQSCCPSIPVFSIEVVPGGEPCKTRQQIERMQRSMLMYGVDRHCFVFAIGGGAVLDAVGFAAASFHRGVNLVRLPTTVLAQNDAGVGVKNGINDQQKKNLIGAFQPPLAVINDQDFLLTLSQRDKRAGLAEAVKVAAIRDQALFEWMEEHADALAHAEPAALAYSIRECARLHLNQIVQGGDPFEYGTARPLDFGHWSAHRMESLVNYQLRHGEAVAIGIALDTEYAVRAGMLCADKGARVCNLLYQLGFQLWHPVLKQQRENGEAAFLEGLEEFRQHLGGTLCITLLTDIGLATEVNSMDRALLLDARDALARRYAVSAGEQTTEAEPVC